MFKKNSILLVLSCICIFVLGINVFAASGTSYSVSTSSSSGTSESIDWSVGENSSVSYGWSSGIGAGHSEGISWSYNENTNNIKINYIDQNNKSITLKWNTVKSASYYCVSADFCAAKKTAYEKDKHPVFMAPKKTKNCNYTITNVIRGNIYEIEVEAYDKNDTLIGRGPASVIKINTPVINSITFPSQGKARIQWNSDPYITRYKLEYVKGTNFKSGVKTIYYKNTIHSADITGLTPGAEYTFRLSAEQTGYLGREKTTSLSARAYKTVKMPQTSSISALSKVKFSGWINKDNGINFSWVKANSVNGYKIFRKECSGAWNLLADVSKTTTSYTDKKTKIGVKYTYSIVGYRTSQKFSYKDGMSETKALVRLTEPEKIIISSHENTYYLNVESGSSSNNSNSFKTADSLIIEITGTDGKVKTAVIKKSSGKFEFKGTNAKYIRMRYGKTVNGALYGGVWTEKMQPFSGVSVYSPSTGQIK